jgi:hypothetical protein
MLLLTHSADCLPTILAAMPAGDKPLDDSMEAFYTIMDCFGGYPIGVVGHQCCQKGKSS